MAFQVKNLRSMVIILAVKCTADMYRSLRRDMASVSRNFILSNYKIHSREQRKASRTPHVVILAPKLDLDDVTHWKTAPGPNAKAPL